TQLDALELYEQGHLPEADGTQIGSLGTVGERVERAPLARRQGARTVEPPKPSMRVEQRRRGHRRASISSSRTTGESTSPMRATLPRSRRQGAEPSSGGGASWATTRPRLVMSTAFPVRRTCSIRLRHSALNRVAVMLLTS